MLEEGGSEILEVLDGRVVRFRPVHRKVERILVALGGVGKISGVGAVGDDKDLEIFEEGMLCVETLFAVAVHLIEGFANGDSSSFQFHLHHRDAVD